MAPVVDCVFLGEAEDEQGNGGIGQVLRMIEMFKAEGSWNEDRVSCYGRLARTFNYLYFPRFVCVEYATAAEHSGKQVSGYRGLLDGMRMPFRKRHVVNLDNIKPLDAPPLLFTNPSLGSGDVEAGRSCPAWCSSHKRCINSRACVASSEKSSVAVNISIVLAVLLITDIPMRTTDTNILITPAAAVL